MRSLHRQTTAFIATVVVVTTSVVGCANWKEERRRPETRLPGIQENARAVILQVEFLPIAVDASDIDSDASLWQWVDETAIDSASRQRLLVNGIRIGRVANEERFRSRLGSLATSQDVLDKFLSEASVASDVSHRGKRIPMRLGRRYELPVKQPSDGSHVTLLRLSDETIGRTLQDPQYLFAVTATAGQVSGQVHLLLRPEIQHGEMRQKWVSSDSALRIDTRRETWSIDELDVEFVGSEGDTFVIAGANPLSGLAKQMFSGTKVDQSQQQVVVLIQVDHVPTAVDQL